jgi:hypothetical protein
VCHNPDPVSPVRRRDGTSWNNKRLDRVTDRTEILTDTFEKQLLLVNTHRRVVDTVRRATTCSALHSNRTAPFDHRNEPSNVFTNDPSGPVSVDSGKHRRPEIAVILRASSLPGHGEGLTGEPPNDNVNWSDMRQLPYIFVDRHIRPVAGQNTASERIGLAERDGLETAGRLKAKTEAPDP